MLPRADALSIAKRFNAWLRGELLRLPHGAVCMAATPNRDSVYPGGSKSRVSRAGNAVRQGAATAEDLAVIDTWREAHRAVLNTFQAILRTRTRGTKVVVAQRHKRKKTIFDKLQRLPRMELARMDDIAGCRLIFPTIEDLYKFRVQEGQIADARPVCYAFQARGKACEPPSPLRLSRNRRGVN